MLFLRLGRATGALGRVFAPSAQSQIRRMSGDAAQVAKTRNKKGRWVWKVLGAGVAAAATLHLVDAGLHPKPQKEIVEDLLLKNSDLKHRKERVVVLGTGWGAVAAMRNLDPFKFEIVCVSPRNYFVMTPLLPSVTVGTIEPRTVVESIRNVCPHVKFVEAECTGLDHLHKIVSVTPSDKMTSSSRAIKDSTRTRPSFEIAYDKLIVAVGAENNTFGTPGVYEHAHFLKEIVDARRIRAAVIDAFESACNPGQSEAERKRLMNFVVVGGGPTGVEFAAELADLVHQDLHTSFPQLKTQVKIQLVEAMDKVLGMFDKRISDFTAENFKREQIDVLSNTMVKEVREREILVQRRGSKTVESIPCSLVVWATGIKCRPVVNKLREAIGLKIQNNFRALMTDEYLEVQGAKDVYSLGDCASIAPKRLTEHVQVMFEDADKDKSGGVSLQEFKDWVQRREAEYPQLHFLASTDQLAEKFKKAGGRSNSLKLEQFKQVCEEADRTLRALPATAQVAAQEGKYLGQRISSMPTQYEEGSALNWVKKQWFAAKGVDDISKPFRYNHMGSLAYVGGDSAAADLTGAFSIADFLNINIMTGKGTFYLWRSFYLSEQCSTRTKLLLLFDWAKATVFGRDVSRY